jgi:hypothetical protein
MQNKKLLAFTAVGLAAAIAVPTIAMGNARSNQAGAVLTQTPFTTRMTGANEVPTPGDTDGIGAAAVTFDLTSGSENVCWDLSYSGITTPLTGAHIHPGVAGVANPPAITFTPGTLGTTSAAGCVALTAPQAVIAADIVANPASYYVNVHNADFPGGALRGQLAQGPAPAGEAHFLPVPLRAYDSRAAAGAKILPNETRTISLASGTNSAGVSFIAVPPGATAAIVTLTVTETTVGVGGPGGFLTMYNAALTTQPSTSSINWAGVDQNVAVNAQVAVDPAGMVKVAAGANATHFVIDVLGFLY